MKHIHESIIGRRSSNRTININDINDIKTGDIVKFRGGLLAMAYINGDKYDSGFYYNNFTENVANNIMSISFSKDLKHKVVNYLDIIAIYRDPDNIIGSDKNFKGFKIGQHYSSLEKSNLQRLIDNGDYKIIYEEK